LLVEVIDEFFLILVIGHTEFEFSFFGTEHDGLAFHAPDHIKGSAGLAAQGHLQHVLLDAGFNGLAQFVLDFKEAIGRTEPFNALVRTLVIVVFDPELDALASHLEAVELGSGQELLPEARPEALDLAERHRMLRTALEVGYPVLLQLGFEATDATPSSILAAIVGQHFLGWLILAHSLPIDFDHRLRCWAAKQIGGRNEARVIIHEGNQVGVTSAQSKREDVTLPHLIGRGPLEETRTGHVPLLAELGLVHQPGPVQTCTHRPGAAG
jgi:hypothetical protein